MSNFETFQYSFRSYDAVDLSPETQEIIDAKDKQLENYLKNNNTTVGSSFVPTTDIRYGTAVITLPAVGAFVNVTYAGLGDINIAEQFDSTVSWLGIRAIVSNGDYAANPAGFAGSEGTNIRTTLRIYHTGGGAVGGLARVNFVAFGIR